MDRNCVRRWLCIITNIYTQHTLVLLHVSRGLLTWNEVVVAIGITWAVCRSRIKARHEKHKLDRNPNELDLSILTAPPDKDSIV